MVEATPLARAKGRRPTPYQRLKLLVVQYRFRPLEPLRPTELAQHFGVSATPIREALTRLYAEGLIMQIPNRGFSTKPLNERDMTDLFEHAFLLIRHAAEKDIQAFTLSGINKPMDLEFGPTGGVVNITDDLLHSHAKFLEQLYERVVSLARNDSMTATIRSFNDKTHYIRLLDLEAPGHLEQIAPMVFDLIDRLLNGNVAGVAHNLSNQSERMRTVLPALIREGNARSYARVAE